MTGNKSIHKNIPMCNILNSSEFKNRCVESYKTTYLRTYKSTFPSKLLFIILNRKLHPFSFSYKYIPRHIVSLK